ncbi:hypothetical protein BDY17DRAFT_160100 [Neohortaea acidophila]|uniref:Uncharacterized protein n=1 Tax=Neohortaea acidophila TaxID=245834 RepID=A0A6A6PQQ0_9PEZI|nr:uncharacterized protein BDY17DRAFT_160100 [Neohortaea acidophila]KAF2482438.1 hypothetical protein BDY17DRAFT_160100 [Neohortaea acidophila]
MDSLKRALNRIFKRGKKNKQDQDKERQDRAAGTSSTSKAPQLPPITNASLLQGSGDERDKPLPSPRPLSMGKQSTPQKSVPESDGSRSALPVATAVAEDTSAKPSESKAPDLAAEKRSSKDDAPVTLQTHDSLASATTKEEAAAEDDTAALTDLDEPPGPPAKSDSGLSGEQTGQ